MTHTGFSHRRAIPHESRVGDLIAMLEIRGYRPVEQPVDGDRPDVLIRDRNGREAYVDVKTTFAHNGRFSIKVDALRTYLAISFVEGKRVYIVWPNDQVDEVSTITGRIMGGPRRPTGKGSNTDWFLIENSQWDAKANNGHGGWILGGTPFNEFFPYLVEVAA